MNKRKLLALPFLLLNSAIIIAALFKGMQISLGYYPLVGLDELSFGNYQQVLTNPFFQKSLVYSVYLALTATFLSLLLGLFLAFLLLKVNSGWLHKIISLPISLPHIIVALMVMQLISQTGILSRLFYQLGWIQEIGQFPLLIHDPGGIGILLVFLYKEIPYVAISTLAILQQLELGYVEVAKNLGASSLRIFWSILLPMLQKTLASLFIILFCFTFASFEVPYLLGSPSHQTVALTAYDLFTQADLMTRPQAFALNLVISGICLGVTLLVLAISRVLPGGRKTS
ncbi:ABC transporter permease subunit [Enterococcus pseudoavium]|uniref:ABC transporter permease subunit n=2 Tax=Enterococcus pseudoavium TaxID=44007 RepID=A0AAE4I3V4_9ENTE|nr:ABC transporter permease subunit [Enterococcus pseudoavium]MDT2738013.1 ABC transporter permease subunit [Enterococcus pseudoavium]MDT2753709.1 ABC transporter permease subunit [Enterococcus pseudoavium]MDT2771292.1 ABC transporter permease subunit [Enterococcus pseudoavium]